MCNCVYYVPSPQEVNLLILGILGGCSVGGSLFSGVLYIVYYFQEAWTVGSLLQVSATGL